MITPTRNHVLVLKDPKTKTEVLSGIIVQSDYKKRTDMHTYLAWGTVVAVGSDIEGVKPGDRLAYNPFDAWDVEEENKQYAIVSEPGLRLTHTSH